MNKSLKIEIPIKCPSWNKLYAGQHWSKRAEMADYYHNLIAIEIRKLKPKPYFEKCLITYVCSFKDKRRHDPDNCMLAAKYFNDGLVKTGIIKDDNSEVVELLQIIVEIGQAEDKCLIVIEEE